MSLMERNQCVGKIALNDFAGHMLLQVFLSVKASVVVRNEPSLNFVDNILHV